MCRPRDWAPAAALGVPAVPARLLHHGESVPPALLPAVLAPRHTQLLTVSS